MKKIISTSNAPKAVGPYSQAVEVNGMLFVSGQVPINPVTGTLVEGGIAEQTHQVLQNIKSILHEAGLTFDNVVKTTCLLSTMESFAVMNGVYAEYFVNHKPARATFAVAGLPLGAMVEIEAIAVR